MKKFALGTVASLACIAFVPAAAQAGNTNLTINFNTIDTFSGQVKSSKRSCKNDRKVSLYRKTPGPNEQVGADRSGPGQGDSEGVWVVTLDEVVAGDYYAKVPAKGNCDGDKSKTLEVNEVGTP